MHEFFARCASGFEGVLADELKHLGMQRVRPLVGGAAFFGPLSSAYTACLWSSVATRIQLVIARVDAHTAEALYTAIYNIPWEDHLTPQATFAVRAHGTSGQLRNTQFTALKVKDAVCDHLRDVRGARPNVDSKHPDVALDVAVHKTKATVYINLSGASLHRRGYRSDGEQTLAPLKETLAAGIIRAAGWPHLIKTEGQVACVDPVCGSGTLAIEAACMAADRAPGLLREQWGFSGWAQHDHAAWTQVYDEACQRAEAGIETAKQRVRILAGDIDAQALQLARANAARAGVDELIEFHHADAARFKTYAQDSGGLPEQGLVLANPPYGQRMFEQNELVAVYQALATVFDAVPDQWGAALITPDATIDTALGCAPDTVLDCYNGPLPATVRIYSTNPAHRTRLELDSFAGAHMSLPVAEANSQQFASRLRKVAKERMKWARKSGVSCYRIYDADLPDYAFAIDIYESDEPESATRHVRMAEYQAPSHIDPARAQRRLADARAIVAALLDVDPSNVFVKVRRKEKGGGQYRDARDSSHIIHVAEAGHRFEVDLSGRLDTGLFLDHRITRNLVGELSAYKRFLNLFAYTGSATVYAAAHGAQSTTTVDMSQPYLAWAQRNMNANGFGGNQHTFVQSDVMAWLADQAQRGAVYDVIFCDPPTFSNSKRMGKHTFDVQRDHVSLLSAIEHIMAPEGTIIFSCNLRSFRLDEAGLREVGLTAEDITAQTIPHDFERTPHIHHCYRIQRLLPNTEQF